MRKVRIISVGLPKLWRRFVPLRLPEILAPLERLIAILHGIHGGSLRCFARALRSQIPRVHMWPLARTHAHYSKTPILFFGLVQELARYGVPKPPVRLAEQTIPVPELFA